MFIIWIFNSPNLFKLRSRKLKTIITYRDMLFRSNCNDPIIKFF